LIKAISAFQRIASGLLKEKLIRLVFII